MKTIFLKQLTIKNIVLSGIIIIGLSISSCKKDDCGGSANSPVSKNTEVKNKAAKMRNSVRKVLKDFIISGVGNSQQSGSGGGSNSYSNTGLSITTYSTPTTNVYSWTDPTTGSSYTLTESSSGSSGGGLGQMAYNGKSFDYNYVLCIKASGGDPSWDGFFSGRDLRGVVAIDGQLVDNDFHLKNLAIFLVLTTGPSGTYKFIDWSSSSVGDGDGIGELLDFSDVVNNTLAGMNDAHFLITSGGHVNVADAGIEMQSDAMVTDLVTNAQYSIDGQISCE